MAQVANPVACKVGPDATVDELLGICERMDPERDPGRLTLIARIGAQAVTSHLPQLVAAVHAAGHPVIWLCDPMHGNTVTTSSGHKTRFVEDIQREIRSFRQVVGSGGGIAGGLHLETTPEDVTECVADASQIARIASSGTAYTSLCDPRLNPRQAVSVVSAWGG
jgi:3-deoxy-7-phosphoheptulonate synthase